MNTKQQHPINAITTINTIIPTPIPPDDGSCITLASSVVINNVSTVEITTPSFVGSNVGEYVGDSEFGVGSLVGAIGSNVGSCVGLEVGEDVSIVGLAVVTGTGACAVYTNDHFISFSNSFGWIQ